MVTAEERPKRGEGACCMMIREKLSSVTERNSTKAKGRIVVEEIFSIAVGPPRPLSELCIYSK